MGNARPFKLLLNFCLFVLPAHTYLKSYYFKLGVIVGVPGSNLSSHKTVAVRTLLSSQFSGVEAGG